MFAGNVFDRHATFRRSLSASLLTGIVFAMTASASGQTGQKAIVPAFFGIGQHTDLKKGTDWARIASQGTNVLAVVADDSFTTLTGSCDSRQTQQYCGPCSPSPTCSGAFDLCLAKCQFTINRNAGQHIFGYVITDSAQRDLGRTQTPTQIPCQRTDQRCALYGGDSDPKYTAPPRDERASSVADWYNTYCPSATDCYIDGIFFDVGPSLDTSVSQWSDDTQHAYYQDLHDKVAGWVNAGACSDALHPQRPCIMINASEFKNEWVTSVADYVVVWERALHGKDNVPPGAEDYLTHFTTPTPTNWWLTDATKTEHVVAVATQNDIDAIVQASQGRGSPFVYIHDRFKYGSLACFFEEEMQALQLQSHGSGKTWCDSTQTCLDITTSPCPKDNLQVIIVTDPSTGNKIPIILTF